MVDKLAIDIALLPPEEIMDEVIKINKRFGPIFYLNKTNRLPHITLSQAVIKTADMTKAKKKLKEIAVNFRLLSLKAALVDKPEVMLEVSNTGELKSLHKIIMDEFSNLVSYDAEEKYFYDQHVRQKSIYYVHRFRTNSAYDNFYPHITLGTTKPISSGQEFSFTAKRIAICHLGNYNTCRQILAETTLGKN